MNISFQFAKKKTGMVLSSISEILSAKSLILNDFGPIFTEFIHVFTFILTTLASLYDIRHSKCKS